MSFDIIYSAATKLAELIRTREVSPVEVVQAHLDRIEAINPKLNAIVTVADGALEAARAAEAAVLAIPNAAVASFAEVYRDRLAGAVIIDPQTRSSGTTTA